MAVGHLDTLSLPPTPRGWFPFLGVLSFHASHRRLARGNHVPNQGKFLTPAFAVVLRDGELCGNANGRRTLQTTHFEPRCPGWKEQYFCPSSDQPLSGSPARPPDQDGTDPPAAGSLKKLYFLLVLSFLSLLQPRDGKRNRFLSLGFRSRSEPKAATLLGSLLCSWPRRAPKTPPCIPRAPGRETAATSGLTPLHPLLGQALWLQQACAALCCQPRPKKR